MPGLLYPIPVPGSTVALNVQYSSHFVTTKASGEGMGLGLAISAEIVKGTRGTPDCQEHQGWWS